MNYTRNSFSVPVGGEAYGESWERIFGSAPHPTPSPQTVLLAFGSFGGECVKCGKRVEATLRAQGFVRCAGCLGERFEQLKASPLPVDVGPTPRFP